jgi:hypothetical protein
MLSGVVALAVRTCMVLALMNGSHTGMMMTIFSAFIGMSWHHHPFDSQSANVY